ncbi:MAG: MSHA pilin protein MshA [Bradyrhizobium sp.]
MNGNPTIYLYNIGNKMNQPRQQQHQQSGFTLIELVMVVVILGILAAVALPKFVDLGSDARVGVMKAVQGSMRAANTMVYAKAASNNQLGVTGSVTINGVAVTTAYGYASSATALASVMDLSPSSDFTVAATTIGHANATTLTTCLITYAIPATGPTYVLDSTGC